ncbi:hypothetical protein SAMN05421687_1233 [Salimicrobium flavidum]|uniref:Uncharacterized protein n=1 Tax=Salimicrobium flavidum TaxID=570947 RepID=A0A1N7KXT4_9BACI|nr:hypothetical protein SAMN05421687_1233 [Salimicrobium flavidum]
MEKCSVKEVRLDFVLNESGSRWLTHEEISNGVIQAIVGAMGTTSLKMSVSSS